MKLSEEDKREIIRLKESGVSNGSLAVKYGVNIDIVKRLIRSYRIHGEKALTKTSKRKFSADFKLEVVQRYLNGESLNSLAAEYDIVNAQILSWIKRYEKDGYNGLIDKKKGRQPKMKEDKDKISKTVNQAADEGKGDSADKAKIKLLEKKNRELEAEVAYLKKLNALVQERKKRESKKK